MAFDVTGGTSMQFGTTWRTGIVAQCFRRKFPGGSDCLMSFNRSRDAHRASDIYC
jgi:hypothetical protein